MHQIQPGRPFFEGVVNGRTGAVVSEEFYPRVLDDGGDVKPLWFEVEPYRFLCALDWEDARKLVVAGHGTVDESFLRHSLAELLDVTDRHTAD